MQIRVRSKKIIIPADSVHHELRNTLSVGVFAGLK
ncbi:MAG: hypothetical protein ACI91J_002563, partial [Yoonia sp.]